MHALLARYADAVRADEHARGVDAWLALSVLHKRALSSAWSLARSVERRLAALSAESESRSTQMALPLGDPQGELIAADEAPAWPADLRLSDPARERRLLSALHQSRARGVNRRNEDRARSSRCSGGRGQSAVVFTEYRDTLLHVRQSLARPALVLHGGLTRDERSAVLASFARDPCGLLLATDAAAEGLNLHHHCRLVVNLELPWNPMRLEQRIGRVDRIGQRRTVHAFHLIAGGTGEDAVAGAAARARGAAKADIGAPDPLDDERAGRAARDGSEEDEVTMTTVDLRAEAVAEARRLATRARAAARRRRTRGHSARGRRDMDRDAAARELKRSARRAHVPRLARRLRGRLGPLRRVEARAGDPRAATRHGASSRADVAAPGFRHCFGTLTARSARRSKRAATSGGPRSFASRTRSRPRDDVGREDIGRQRRRAVRPPLNQACSIGAPIAHARLTRRPLPRPNASPRIAGTRSRASARDRATAGAAAAGPRAVAMLPGIDGHLLVRARFIEQHAAGGRRHRPDRRASGAPRARRLACGLRHARSGLDTAHHAAVGGAAVRRARLRAGGARRTGRTGDRRHAAIARSLGRAAGVAVGRGARSAVAARRSRRRRGGRPRGA